ncbi:Glutathione peroxidase homolog BsaA [Candidatus Ornithobacterium hominis]|uniref:Glutathione peroxidase n=1 Tax=Candidatus Ornithobacterium hominis TaxID=2497989 RepID=A0A383TZL0_9FLAO|nr:redoxin domain-containing protein [Candidatus Ornithobacterium hominis]MCT7904342.1 redoxin domain-containing protein [Candidatus Ornithobacterium hominis]SZD73035.1 Glutathione peroxidase homolog BsaA [Candidatus Ornithobacterium hominis]
MKKHLITIVSCIILFSCEKKQSNQSSPEIAEIQETEPKEKLSFFDFTVKDIDGNDFDLKQLKGKKILVVNTASECGFTSQYEDLQKLYEAYKNQNFTVIGFPANDFGEQEPGDNQKIKQFCTQQFKVTFPMMSKISVIGKEQHPLYQFLTQKNKNGKMDSEVKWNFQKYLINPDGSLAEVYYSKTNPMDEKIQSWIKS